MKAIQIFALASVAHGNNKDFSDSSHRFLRDSTGDAKSLILEIDQDSSLEVWVGSDL